MNYRSDIDGLRAIACLSVVIFHAFPSYLHGGFIGVDIFFVISGFLISSILYRTLFNPEAPGRVNIVDFYIRRVRRIFPALIAVLITTLIIGWFILLPAEYRLLGKHAISGAIYISNISLYNEAGDYFNVASNAKPLLHLWSLGVEEQFYLIFPVLLWILYKTRINFVISLAVFTLISLILNIYEVNTNHQTAAFYLPWCRFWELSIGAILAYIVNYYHDSVTRAKSFITDNAIAVSVSKIIFRKNSDDLRHNLVNNVISLAGLALIIYGIFTIKNDITFPGTKALIPVFGALMIIGAGNTAFINKYILSNRVMVFLGLISYPLYLWHWPLLSLPYIFEGQIPEAWVRAVAVVLSIVLATITYLVIEPPLRYGLHSKAKAIGLFIALLAVGCMGIVIQVNKGFPRRINSFPYEFQTSFAWNKDRFNQSFVDYQDDELRNTVQHLQSKADRCLLDHPAWNLIKYRCYMEQDRSRVKFTVMGDSHGGNLVYGLQKLADRDNFGFDLFEWSGNIPLYGFMSFTFVQNNEHREEGSDAMVNAYNTEILNPNIELFVICHNPLFSFVDMTDKIDPTTNSKTPLEKYRVGVKRTVDFLVSHGKKVLFVLDNPPLPFSATSCMKRPFKSTAKKCSFSKDYYASLEAYSTYNQAVKEIAKEYSMVQIIDLADMLCNEKECTAEINNEILYSDDHHTNLKGSVVFSEYVYDKIKEITK
ncbi:MAG: acyltransferase family protein [Succinivibrio sp.]